MFHLSGKAKFNVSIYELAFMGLLFTSFVIESAVSAFTEKEYYMGISWSVIMLFPLLIRFMVVNGIKVKNIIGHTKYNESLLLYRKLRSRYSASDPQPTPEYEALYEKYNNLAMLPKKHIEEYIAAYVVLVHKKNIFAIHCLSVATAILFSPFFDDLFLLCL